MKQPTDLTKALEVIMKQAEVISEEKLAPETDFGPSLGYGVDFNSENETHLLDYWRSIRKRLWLVISITLLVTALAAVYMARKRDIYEAETRVQVNQENSGAPVGSKNAQVIFTSDNNDPTYFNTQIQILSSPALLRRVVKALDLEHNQAFKNPEAVKPTSTWQSLLRMVGLRRENADNTKALRENTLLAGTKLAPATAHENLEEVSELAPYVDQIRGGLKVERVIDDQSQSFTKETRLVDIRFRHADPQVAAKIANAVADTFALSNLEKKTETNTTTSAFLQKRVAELQSQIRSDEEKLINYAKNNQILSLDASQNTVVGRLVGLSGQLLVAENDRKQAEAAYRAALAPGAADAMVQTEIKATEEKLADLRQRREQLLVENTEEWPEVKDVEQQIKSLETHLKEARGQANTTLVKNLESRYRQASAQEESLRKAFDQQRGETLSQNEAAINYRIIQQEIETSKSLLDNMLQGSRENDVVLAGTPNNISVVDYAMIPKGAVGPKRWQTVILSFLLSAAFGIGLALFLEYMNDTVRSPDDVEKLLRLPALAVIPTIGGTLSRRLLPGAGAFQGRNGHGTDLLVNVDNRSPLAEAYKHLRTSVLLSSAGRPPKTLLVTSSLPAEGKTTTAVNMAKSLAQTGASVVLIDADMRRPRLHKIFGIENKQGLSNILSTEMKEAEMLNLVVQHAESGVHVLNSGPMPPNPAELVGSSQMQNLISTLESTFGYVVIDSPPVASFTDSVLLSALTDGVLLVVHGGKSSRNIVRRSRQMLQDVGAKVLGVVLNNVNLASHDYYYYQRYYSSYYSADTDDLVDSKLANTAPEHTA